MSALSGLGAFAGGFGQGMERGQDLLDRRSAADFRKEQQTQQREQWARDKALNSDLDAANAAGAERLKSFMPVAPDGNTMNRNLGGTDSSMPDQTATDSVPKAEPFRPTQEQLMASAQARTDKLFELGRHDQAVQQWVKDESLRGQLRKQAVEKGMMQFKTTGDPTPLLQGVYSHLDDGWSIKSVVPTKDVNGAPVYSVERVNQHTGEAKTNAVAPDEIQGLVQFALDPVEAAKYSLKEKLAAFKANEDRKTKHVEGEEHRDTQAEKHVLTLDEIEKRTRGEQRVKATPPGEPNEVTLGEGAVRVRKGLGGTYQEVAKGAPKTPKPTDPVKDAENLLDTLAKAGIGGTKDLLSGRVLPDGLTQKAAQRVNQLRKTGGMGVDEAIAQTRDEMTTRGLLK